MALCSIVSNDININFASKVSLFSLYINYSRDAVKQVCLEIWLLNLKYFIRRTFMFLRTKFFFFNFTILLIYWTLLIISSPLYCLDSCWRVYFTVQGFRSNLVPYGKWYIFSPLNIELGICTRMTQELSTMPFPPSPDHNFWLFRCLFIRLLKIWIEDNSTTLGGTWILNWESLPDEWLKSWIRRHLPTYLTITFGSLDACSIAFLWIIIFYMLFIIHSK